jgi:pimeloyl-ACP methyl ester carboxylesterase
VTIVFDETRFNVGKMALNVAVGPKNGPPLVLFHGVCRRWHDYGPVLATLSSRWQVFAVDHRGHGRSSRADSYLVADYVADAAAFLRTLESPPILVGHSLGGLVSLGAAATTEVRGIVLEDPPSAGFLDRIDETNYGVQFRAARDLAGSDRPIAEVAHSCAAIRFADGTRLGDRRDAAALRFMARCLVDLDPVALTPVIERRWLTGYDPLAAAAKVKCPALLLAGDVALGGMLPSEDATALARALPDASRIDCVGIGHQIRGTRPDLYLQAVVNFIDSL